MKRIFLAFLLLALAVLLIPGLRQRAQPRIDQSRLWLWGKLEGPMSPVLTPYRILTTQSRLAEPAASLIRARNRGYGVPRPDDFEAYLTGHGMETTDAWGMPLILRQEPDSLAVVSPGPDLDYETDDDVVSKIRYKARSRTSPFRRR